jgi:hypothetical protein
MKKQLALVVAGILIFTSCQKSVISEEEAVVSTQAVSGQRKCASYEVLQEQLAADPGLRQKMDEIEAFTQRFIKNKESARLLANGIIEIPVVFNVLYKTAAQNVNDEQLNSQINVLNADYSGTNSDISNTPDLFKRLTAGDIRIVFVRDQIIVRKKTNKTQWSTNDAMKKSKQGGIDPTDPATKLNIWVCNLGGGILGYAQFPGGKAATDGVVLDDNATGSTGTATAPFGLGRTATHEVGHWLNLRHIWGDATCGNDYVEDTPLHNTANYGCPVYPHYSTCKNTPVEMTMNYMDYTDDACMYMFTGGQRSRILATFGSGGGRNSFAQP